MVKMYSCVMVMNAEYVLPTSVIMFSLIKRCYTGDLILLYLV